MRKILIVDNKAQLNSLEKILKQECKDVEILSALNYKVALKYSLLHQDKIDIAILNLHYPNNKDIAFLDATIEKEFPCIVLTDYIDENLTKILFEKDIVDFILKDKKRGMSSIVNSVKRVLKNYDTHILLVDDSLLQLSLAKKMLKKMKLNVTTAKDGQEAYDILEKNENKFSLVLTDYNMPKMDGMELIIKIREKYDKDHLGIIVLSSNKTPEIPTKFIKVGANDFINKPYSEIEVATRVNSNLDLIELFQKTRDMANKDFLTGAYNRRYFFDSGQAIFGKAQRNKKDIVLATFDIDKFKNINDTYGHDIGDIAICEVTKILNNNLRKDDLMARFGGEEFCVLLENINLEDTKKLFEKIRVAFEENVIEIDDLKIKFTTSIGVCYGLYDSLEKMITISDKGLYYCKNNGRNQTAINIT